MGFVCSLYGYAVLVRYDTYRVSRNSNAILQRKMNRIAIKLRTQSLNDFYSDVRPRHAVGVPRCDLTGRDLAQRIPRRHSGKPSISIIAEG